MKYTITRFVLAISACLGAATANAQNIQYSLFDAMPLTLNPSYTGMTDGRIRGNLIYRNQWKSITVPFVSLGASVDAPVLALKNGDYFGAGVLAMNDRAGDGSLTNTMGVASVSYHKMLGKDSAFYKGRGCDLALGLQGGYGESVMDMSRQYFLASTNSTYLPPAGGSIAILPNMVNYYIINAGVSFSQSVNKRFNYIVGVKANNINQPNDALLKKQNERVGLDTRYVLSAGANIGVTKRFALRPAMVLSKNEHFSHVIIGNEFRYEMKALRTPPSIFVGTWYRTGDVAMIMAGVNVGPIRVAMAYDYNLSALNAASNGSGGFEVAVGYTSPRKTHRNRHVPCTRF